LLGLFTTTQNRIEQRRKERWLLSYYKRSPVLCKKSVLNCTANWRTAAQPQQTTPTLGYTTKLTHSYNSCTIGRVQIALARTA
jgi:hypothetical protein